MNPVERYLHPDEQLTFYDAILRGRQKGHIVLVRRRPVLPCTPAQLSTPGRTGPLQGVCRWLRSCAAHTEGRVGNGQLLERQCCDSRAVVLYMQGYCERDSGKIVLNPKNKGARFLSRESTEAFVVLAESP